MAIYSLNLEIVQRSKGKSIVNVAASAAKEKLYDERLNKTFNYKKNSSCVLYKEILSPESLPLSINTRDKLWNHIKRIEKRKDSQLARKFGIALPNEFNLEQNIKVSKEYAKDLFFKKGFVVDLCIFNTKENSDPYLILLITTRRIENGKFLQKGRTINNLKQLQIWREGWKIILNKHLKKNGYNNQKVSHKSLKNQGIDLLPQGKNGAKDARKRLTEIAKREEEKIKINEQILLNNPEIILDSLSKQYAEFSEKELDRFIKRNVLSDENFNKVKTMILKNDKLINKKGQVYIVKKEGEE